MSKVPAWGEEFLDFTAWQKASRGRESKTQRNGQELVIFIRHPLLLCRDDNGVDPFSYLSAW